MRTAERAATAAQAAADSATAATLGAAASPQSAESSGDAKICAAANSSAAYGCLPDSLTANGSYAPVEDANSAARTAGSSVELTQLRQQLQQQLSDLNTSMRRLSGVGGLTDSTDPQLPAGAGIYELSLPRSADSCSSQKGTGASNTYIPVADDEAEQQLAAQLGSNSDVVTAEDAASSRSCTPAEQLLPPDPAAANTSLLPSQHVTPRRTTGDATCGQMMTPRGQQPVAWSRVVTPLMRHLITPRDAASLPWPTQQQQQQQGHLLTEQQEQQPQEQLVVAGQQQPQQPQEQLPAGEEQQQQESEQGPHPLLVHMRLSSVIAASAAVRGSYSSLSSRSSAVLGSLQLSSASCQPVDLTAAANAAGGGVAGDSSRCNSTASSSSSRRSSVASEHLVHSGAAETLFVCSRAASSSDGSVEQAVQQEGQEMQLWLAGESANLSRCSSSASMVLQPCLTPTEQMPVASRELNQGAIAAAAAEAEDAGSNYLLQRYDEAVGAVDDWQINCTAEGERSISMSPSAVCSSRSGGRCSAGMPPQSAPGYGGSAELQLSPSWQQLAQLQQQRLDTSAGGVLAGSRDSEAMRGADVAAVDADAWQCCSSSAHLFDHGNVQITGLELSFSTVSSSCSLSSELVAAAAAAGSSMAAAAAEAAEYAVWVQPPVMLAAADSTAQAAASPAAICNMPQAGWFQPPVMQAETSALPQASSAANAAGWQAGEASTALQGAAAAAAEAANEYHRQHYVTHQPAEEYDEVCFSSPAPSLPPRLASQSVTPKQSARTRSRTTAVLNTLPADSILTAASPGSIRAYGSSSTAAAAAAGAGAGGRSSWHAGMVPKPSPFAAAGADMPPAEMRYSVRHSLADADGKPPLPASAAATLRAASRSCTDVLLTPSRRSSSSSGLGVSTNCLFEPVPTGQLEQLDPVLLTNARQSSNGDAMPLMQTRSSCMVQDGTAAAAAAAASGTPRETRASSAASGDALGVNAASAAEGVAGSGQPPQLFSLLGGALDSLAALQGVLHEGQQAADALLSR
jgi:hypothetical protein